MPFTKAINEQGVALPIREAVFPAPFVSGLEYAAPARGPWNIVHIGMLLPESHQVFVCAAGCLRGVVLTAAEMGAQSRFSTIAIREHNLLTGDLETMLIDGVSHIVEKLPQKPRAMLIFTTCIHHFTGCDLNLIFRSLRQRFPGIDFTDCYMTPILRKSATPDSVMRKQLYSLLRPLPQEAKTVNLIGSNAPIQAASELMTMLLKGGYTVREITSCKSYDDYLRMGASKANISCLPPAIPAGEALQRRLGQRHLHLPLSYGYGEIRQSIRHLAETFSLPLPDLTAEEAAAEAALQKSKAVLHDTPIAIDYTATPRPLGLARLLLEHGFCVDAVYGDSFIPEEKEDFSWLQENAPALKLYATVHAKMGLLPHNAALHSQGRFLAIGQKAAYFSGTRHFVNLLEGGGLWGFRGICALAKAIQDAMTEEKDTKAIIQVKGWGCCG